MMKTPKKAEELKEVILDRIGIKVTVRAHQTQGWIATPYALQSYTSADLAELDKLVIELRRKYVVKNE